MSNNDNIELKSSKDSKKDINIKCSNNAEINPIITQLKELGYDDIYIRRVFHYLHPIDLNEALDYMSIENGIIQHHFIHERNKSNNLCYICNNSEEKHLKYQSNNNNDVIQISILANDELSSQTSSNISFNNKNNI